MTDLVLTGASRGIGRALALELAKPGRRMLLVARDANALDALCAEVAARGGAALAVPGDLSTLGGARSAGARLAAQVAPGATLVHNAGLWPSRRVATADGYESAFAVNCLGPLALQDPLVASGKLARVLVVGAGLMVKGRFDPLRTPTGADFSSLRTYCSTKLAFAVAMRDFAARHPALDVLVLHPGVVRTDLGSRAGLLGWVLKRVKRRWESPEVCAARLGRILAEAQRWSPPGEPRWRFEEREQPWPEVADAQRGAILDALQRIAPGRA